MKTGYSIYPVIEEACVILNSSRKGLGCTRKTPPTPAGVVLPILFKSSIYPRPASECVDRAIAARSRVPDSWTSDIVLFASSETL